LPVPDRPAKLPREAVVAARGRPEERVESGHRDARRATQGGHPVPGCGCIAPREAVVAALSERVTRLRPLRWCAVHLWAPLLQLVQDTYRSQSYPLGYAPGLDGLRGAMTIGVILAHTRSALAPGAVLYMDVFFVMSGYFITSLLLRDWDRYGYIRFIPFYLRRFGRIVPPLLAMVAGYVAFAYFFLPDFSTTLNDAAVASAYVMNLARAGLLGWFTPERSYLGHTWSLAIEEQFYLLWPCMFLVALRCFGASWRTFGCIVAMAFALWAWRVDLMWLGTPMQRLYNGTDTRADALLFGCALALWLHLVPRDSRGGLYRVLTALAWPLAIVIVVLNVVPMTWGVTGDFYWESSPVYYYGGSVLCGVLPGIALVLILTGPSRTVLHFVFEQPILVFVGRIFYAIYLWHLPIFTIMQWHYRLRTPWVIGVGYPLVLLLALLSYVLIERHFMRSAKRTRPAPVAAT
jgi:peptidoglycan/LPS O-acetylase OafA/YrhL